MASLKEKTGMMSPYRGRGFYDVQSEVNRLFDQMFGGLARQAGTQQRQPAVEWAPSIDVLQREGDLVIRAEIPGVRSEDVDVTLHDGVLTLSGKREEAREEERGGYLVRERRSGSFRRSLQLPEGVDESAVRARFENGVLEVTVEGAAAVREPKRIRIEPAEGSGGDVEVQGAEEKSEGDSDQQS